MKVLVLTSEPVDAEMVRGALGGEADGAEVLVVAPALNESKLAFWISDPDEAIGDADQVQEETVERLEEDDLDASGDTGESDPLVALEDALATFEAERILIFAHPDQEQKYLEDDLAGEAERRFGVPVVQSVIGR